MNQGESIITSLETLKSLVQQRYNPLRGISAARLAAWLDAFEYGELREVVMLWEQIAERDDTIKSVKPKREKSVSGLEVVYQPMPGTGPAGAAQAQTLEHFWRNIRATNAYDRNVSGGLRLFLQQMMTAVSYRYAVHHIVWSPRASGLTATFEFVPLWLFENRRGKLRYLKNPYDYNGQDIVDDEWLVTTGEGLMIACSIGWFAKRETYNDWLIFSKHFSIPGVLGRTKAAMGSPEGLAMRSAVLAFGQELKGVLYSDDGTIAKPIELIQAQGSPNGMPMPAIIDRVDRKIVTLYRGADLSTISSRSGQGAGASLQQDEQRILLDDDIAMIEEQLATISRMVLEWTYGSDAEIMAEVKLLLPKHQTPASLKAAASGTDINPAMEAADSGVTPASVEEANADVPTPPNMSAFHAALSEDMRPLGRALEQALHAGDGPALRGALSKISARMPDFIHSDAMSNLLASDMASALIGGTKQSS